MIKIAICDDDRNILLLNEKRVKNYLRRIGQIAEVVVYQSGEFLFFDIQENQFFIFKRMKKIVCSSQI